MSTTISKLANVIIPVADQDRAIEDVDAYHAELKARGVESTRRSSGSAKTFRRRSGCATTKATSSTSFRAVTIDKPANHVGHAVGSSARRYHD